MHMHVCLNVSILSKSDPANVDARKDTRPYLSRAFHGCHPLRIGATFVLFTPQAVHRSCEVHIPRTNAVVSVSIVFKDFNLPFPLAPLRDQSAVEDRTMDVHCCYRRQWLPHHHHPLRSVPARCEALGSLSRRFMLVPTDTARYRVFCGWSVSLQRAGRVILDNHS